MSNIIEGYLVRFGSPDDKDLDNEYFSKDTEFDIPKKGTVMYHSNGFDEFAFAFQYDQGIESDNTGLILRAKFPEGALFVKSGKELSQEFFEAFKDLVEKGAYKFVPEGEFQVDDNGKITKAKVSGISPTIQPSDPKAIPVRIIKDE